MYQDDNEWDQNLETNKKKGHIDFKRKDLKKSLNEET